MISYAAPLIVSTSKTQKDALYSSSQFVWFVISALRYLKLRLKLIFHKEFILRRPSILLTGKP